MQKLQPLSHCITNQPYCADIEQNKTAVLVITLKVISIFGFVYTISRCTSLGKTYEFFKPLESLSDSHFSLTLTAWTALGIIWMSMLIHMHRKSEYAPHKLLSTFNQFERICGQTPENKQHYYVIKQCLVKGFTHSLDHYDFYYHLASLSEYVLTQENVNITAWKALLHEIHGLKIHHQNSNRDISIDCSLELMRLEGTKPQLTIGPLQTDSPFLDNDLKDLLQICIEAFSDWPSQNEIKDVHNHFLKQNNTIYVIRSKIQKILGFVVLEEQNDGNENNLFFHTLARSAHVAKLGLTKQLSAYFKQILERKKYSAVYCTVSRDNKPAKYIYEILGFIVTGIDKRYNQYLMEYQP